MAENYVHRVGRTGPGIAEAMSLIASGNYKNAEQSLNKAAGTAGNESALAEVLPLQARVLEQSGKFAQAQDVYAKLLKLQEKNGASQTDIARTKSQLAVPMLDQGNVDAAEPLLIDAEKVLTHAPEQEKEGLSHVYYGLSRVALARGDYEKATENLEAGITRLTEKRGLMILNWFSSGNVWGRFISCREDLMIPKRLTKKCSSWQKRNSEKAQRKLLMLTRIWELCISRKDN